MKHNTRICGILLAGCLGIGGFGLSGLGRQACSSARAFVSYYRALERAEVPAGFFERVAFSLVLAGANPPAQGCRRTPTSF